MTRQYRNPVTGNDPFANAARSAFDFMAQGFSGPTQEEQRLLAAKEALALQQGRNYAADAAKTNLEARGLERTYGARDDIADIFGSMYDATGATPGAMGPYVPGDVAAGMFQPALTQSAFDLVGENTEDVGDVLRALTAQAPYADDALLDRTMIGAGSDFEDTARGFGMAEANDLAQAFGVADRDNVAAMDRLQWESMNAPTLSQAQASAFADLDPVLQALTVGPSETEVQGGLLAENFGDLGGLSPEQREVLGANVSATPRNWIHEGGGQGVTLDGVTDAATGQPIPAGARIYTGQLQGTGEETGLTNRTRQNLEQGQIAFRDFTSTMDMLQSIAEQDPSLFGVTGNVRRFGQGVAGQANALSAALGAGEFDNVAAELAEAGVAPRFFDPNLNDIEKIATLAAYQAASALAGQEGRGLSDRDFQVFRGMIGDPSAWLASQQSFLAGLTRIRDLATEMFNNRIQIRNEGLSSEPIEPRREPATRIRIDQDGNILQ